LLTLINENTTEGVIAHFVKFKILLSIQSYFLKARANFAVKKASNDIYITKNMGKIKGDSEHKTNCCIKLRYYFWLMMAQLYHLLFYFFPIVFIVAPL
jgi:hypothetical protein